MQSVNSETVIEKTRSRSLGAAKQSFEKYLDLMKLTAKQEENQKDDSETTLDLIKEISKEPPKLSKKSKGKNK